jgi:hypothetical protein
MSAITFSVDSFSVDFTGTADPEDVRAALTTPDVLSATLDLDSVRLENT